MKTALKLLLLLLAATYLVYAVVTDWQPTEQRMCQAVRATVKHRQGMEYMDTAYVLGILRRSKLPLVGEQLCSIHLDTLQALLQADPYVDSAKCFHTDMGVLQIEVRPRQPILMVMADKGEPYYIDSQGHTMPLGEFCLPLCVATGQITRQYAQEHLLQLAAYIGAHPFWSHQIEQIEVQNPQRICLYPRVGEHAIVLGDDTRYEQKLDKMLTFYQKGFPQFGWNRYRTIDLSFRGQVVCTK